MPGFNGLGLHLGNLSRLSHAKTRSISPENFDGAVGRGGRATEGTGAKPAAGLGQGWKVSPSIWIEPGEHHWHGGGADTCMLHMAAVWGETTWLEPVTDDEYAALAG